MDYFRFGKASTSTFWDRWETSYRCMHLSVSMRVIKMRSNITQKDNWPQKGLLFVCVLFYVLRHSIIGDKKNCLLDLVMIWKYQYEIMLKGYPSRRLLAESLLQRPKKMYRRSANNNCCIYTSQGYKKSIILIFSQGLDDVWFFIAIDHRALPCASQFIIIIIKHFFLFFLVHIREHVIIFLTFYDRYLRWWFYFLFLPFWRAVL